VWDRTVYRVRVDDAKLSEIVHLKFRAELMDAAREFGYWEKQPAALGS
jgi:hypothetical protein